jgi:hypothetical protein
MQPEVLVTRIFRLCRHSLQIKNFGPSNKNPLVDALIGDHNIVGAKSSCKNVGRVFLLEDLRKIVWNPVLEIDELKIPQFKPICARYSDNTSI